MTDVSFCSLRLQQEFETYLAAAVRYAETGSELDRRRRDDYKLIFEDSLLIWFKLIGYNTRENVLTGLFTGAIYRNSSFDSLPPKTLDDRDRAAHLAAKRFLPTTMPHS